MRRWISIAAYARREGITENVACQRAAKYVWLGVWERKLAMKKGRQVLVFRDMSLKWPKHNGEEEL